MPGDDTPFGRGGVMGRETAPVEPRFSSYRRARGSRSCLGFSGPETPTHRVFGPFQILYL